MTAVVSLNAEKREKAGTGAARAVRREQKVPAVLYSNGKQPVMLTLDKKDLTLAYQKGAFFSKLVELKVGGETVRALPRDVQLHPVSDVIEHADFLKVEKDTLVRVHVPVRFKGADKSPGIKRGGVLNVVRHEIEFLCHPDRIPEFILVDVEGTDIGDSRHINDIGLPEGVTPTIKRNFTVATIAGRSSKMDIEETTTAAAATTVEGGEAAATVEGGAAPAAAAAPAKDAGKKDAGKKE